MNTKLFNRFGAGAAAIALAIGCAGGYVARAETEGHAVNARPSAPAPVSPGAPSFADIVQRVAPAVVSIDVDGKVSQVSGPRSFRFGGPGNDDDSDLDGLPFEFRRFFQQAPQDLQPQVMHGAGSGFFISSDGYVATNNHVIENADKITVHTADKRSFPAHVVGRDKATDLAVLKVDGKNFPFVSFEDSAKPRVGDWVVAVGNPFGLGGTATAGIVSAFGRNSGSSYVDYMQIDAPINPGNSGGPTFDLYGRVVGINSAIYSRSGGSVGIGFDIPADVAASVTKQLISGGKVARGYIGATIQDVTPDIAESLGIDAKGALVADVAAGGPAQSAGLKAGDVVLRADGRVLTGASDLTRQVGLTRAGGSLRLDIRRDGKPMQISVRAGARPDEEKLAANDRTSNGDDSDTLLGLRVMPDPQGRGARVADVARGSPAAARGLRTGDVIVRAGDDTVRSPIDLADAVSKARSSGHKQVLLLVARGGQRTFVPVSIS